jgi:hypothetical protein
MPYTLTDHNLPTLWDTHFTNLIITPQQIYDLLFMTECSDKPYYLDHFSYAGGNSSYSFGVMQFDVRANPAVAPFLLGNGFSQQEVDKLKRKDKKLIDPKEKEVLDKKLQAIPQDKMDEFVCKQILALMGEVNYLIRKVRSVNPEAGFAVINSEEMQLRIVDFCNQHGNRPINALQDYLEDGGCYRLGVGGLNNLPGTHFFPSGDIDIPWFVENLQRFVKTKVYLDHPRAQRLNDALKQLGVLQQWRKLQFPSGNAHLCDFSQGSTWPTLLERDPLGISPPFDDGDPTHGGLF